MAAGNKGGRPPKPTNMKLLHGDAEKNPQRINRNEPIAPEAEIAPPGDLSDDARAVWDRLSPSLIAAGVLTYWDTDTFAIVCNAVVDYWRARKYVDNSPPLVQGSTGLIKNPAIGAMKDAEATLSAYGSRFGMTPSDRTKIKVDAAGGGDKGKDAARLLS